MLAYFGLVIILGTFSCWLMTHTLSYNPQQKQILVSGKYWSDFGGHLPQIRSFSIGKNWPPEYPLYPGEPIRYHFLFYALVGLLEKTGVRLDYALNIPSSLGFFFMCMMLFSVSKHLFKKNSVAILSVLLLIFNGSLSYVDFFTHRSLNSSLIQDLVTNKDYPSFGPWNGSDIAAFWNLNIFTNQRHLALSFAVALSVLNILLLKKTKLIYLIGFLTGFLLLLNQAVFLIVSVLIASAFLLLPQFRKPIVISIWGFLPWLVFSLMYIHPTAHITIKPGFLFSGPLTPINFLLYWFKNIGPALFLIPIGLLFIPRKARFILPAMTFCFIIPNIFQLSVDMINNHKFFNFYLLLGGVFSSYVIVRLFSQRSLIVKILSLTILIFCLLGGLIDFFPLKNDSYYAIPDIQSNSESQFFLTHTPPDAIILNSTWFYHPASIAGRKVFNGYPYFTWSFGYDQNKREKLTAQIYSSHSLLDACDLLFQHHISYVEINPNHESFINPNWGVWNILRPVYVNIVDQTKIYQVSQICHL